MAAILIQFCSDLGPEK